MKNDLPTTNYLARAQASQYDALQRRVSLLCQHWLDHTAKIHTSMVIPGLCEYIDGQDLPHLKGSKAEFFSTKSDFYLGRVISCFIDIQDEKGEELAEKRREIDIVLSHFSYLINNQDAQAAGVNLRHINKPQQIAENHPKSKTWLKRMLQRFNQRR